MNNSNYLWELILSELQKILDPEFFNRWYSHSHIDSVDFKNKTITIVSEYPDIASFLQHTQDDTLKNILFKTTNVNFSIHYSVVGDNIDTSNVFSSESKSINSESVSFETSLMMTMLNSDKPSGAQNLYGKQQLPLTEYQQPKTNGNLFSTANPSLNKDFTFDNFVIGPGNQYAYTCAYSVAATPGTAYNPLFIYGGVGLGKTHLLHAIGNQLEKNYPDMKIQCVSSETFVNDFLSALLTSKSGNNNTYDGRTEDFNKKYRDVDALLIDDIQFLTGKEETQNKFFHIFNELQQSKKQIVLISDRGPAHLKGLEDRLVTRFQQGATTDITPPDFETRIGILKHKSGQLNIDLTEDMLVFIANSVSSNIRELEGVLNSIKLISETKNEKPSMSIAEQALKSVVSSERRKIEPSAIISICADYFKVSKEALLSASRRKELVFARQVAIYLCRDLTDLSYPNIARHFNKDHSSIVYSCNQISKLITSDPAVKEEIEKLKERIKNI